MIREEIRDSKWQYPFILHRPAQMQEKMPLILELHGAGERGLGEEDLAVMETNGFSHILTKEADYPCIVVMPQCRPESYWAAEIPYIREFLRQLVEEYPIDTDRISLTGLSMGGYGTWLTATRYPELFAAIAPVCGGGMVWAAGALTMPVWAFHGTEDDVVYPTESINMIQKIRIWGREDQEVRLTMLDGMGHDIGRIVYREELLLWLLSHRRA